MSRRVRAGQVRVYFRGRVIRVINNDNAARLLNAGKATDVWRGDEFVGVELRGSLAEVAQLRTKAAGIVRTEMHSIVGSDLRGAAKEQDASKPVKVLSKYEAAAVAESHASRTEGMSFTDPRRDTRVAAGFSEMDAAEAARVKFDAMFGYGSASRPSKVSQAVSAGAARVRKTEKPGCATYSVMNDPEALRNVVVVSRAQVEAENAMRARRGMRMAVAA